MCAPLYLISFPVVRSHLCIFLILGLCQCSHNRMPGTEKTKAVSAMQRSKLKPAPQLTYVSEGVEKATSEANLLAFVGQKFLVLTLALMRFACCQYANVMKQISALQMAMDQAALQRALPGDSLLTGVYQFEWFALDHTCPLLLARGRIDVAVCHIAKVCQLDSSRLAFFLERIAGHNYCVVHIPFRG